MNWRAGIALAILAFIGGGLAFNWLASAGLSPWDETTQRPPEPVLPEMPPPAANPVAATPVVPQIVQPIADSARTEAMLVAMTARRTIEAGAALGPLEPRLRAAFGNSSPTALAQILAADKERLTAAQLLKEFDAIAPTLQRPPTVTFNSLYRELSTLFVIRRGNTPPAAEDAQLKLARDYLAAGNVAAGLRFVSSMPGAVNADDWIAKARRYVERQKALDTIDQAALTLPVAGPQIAPPAAPENEEVLPEPAL